jgi:opacity protein-like surface antigen
VKSHLVRITVASVALMLASTAQAQYQYDRPNLNGFSKDQSITIVNWEISKPIGGFSDNYISDWSLRGFSVEGRRKIQQNISAGLSFSWNRWNQTYNNLSVTIPGGVISGPVYRYVDMFAIRALAHYYFMDGPIQPYAGFGIGGTWGYAFQQTADLVRDQNGFYFIVDPEIGVLVQLVGGRESLNLNLAFRYTYTTVDAGKAPETHNISPIIGLAWAF